MSELVNQARGLINAASAAIAASRRAPPSTASSLLAGLIVNEAKKQRPNDAAIQSIDLEGNIRAWNDINVAMNVVVRTLD
jgi:hypothetical protein